MSDEWIRGRLAKAGLSRMHAREMGEVYDRVLLRVDKSGTVTEEWLDKFGKPVAGPAWRIQE
ncbi:hypothetical protein MHM88_02890 [Epibacterium sp. MM17-32]|uniref:hypothetical protein n=1 Tax=Epibacterium sp. MM17-32 TaxID=2917734 RepID=UPI001EF73300|nr:hypothetical protein [Epibacterium sp. MM17-32]MCG7626735.1 hypothetical protein [Epibacterium sp. MM17-32]